MSALRKKNKNRKIETKISIADLRGFVEACRSWLLNQKNSVWINEAMVDKLGRSFENRGSSCPKGERVGSKKL